MSKVYDIELRTGYCDLPFIFYSLLTMHYSQLSHPCKLGVIAHTPG